LGHRLSRPAPCQARATPQLSLNSILSQFFGACEDYQMYRLLFLSFVYLERGLNHTYTQAGIHFSWSFCCANTFPDCSCVGASSCSDKEGAVPGLLWRDRLGPYPRLNPLIVEISPESPTLNYMHA